MKSLLFVLITLSTILSAQAGIVNDGNSRKYLYHAIALSHDYAGPSVIDFGGGALAKQEAYDSMAVFSIIRFDGRVESYISMNISPLKTINEAGHPIYDLQTIEIRLMNNPEEEELDGLQLINPNSRLSLVQVKRLTDNTLSVRAVSSTGDYDLTMTLTKD